MVGEETTTKSDLADKIAERLYRKQLEGGDIKTKKKKKIEEDFKPKFPQSAGINKKVKQGKAFTILMKTNGGFNLKWRPIKDDQVYIKEVDKFYSVTTDSIGYYKRYPTILITEWDLQALCRKYLWDKAEEGRYANPQTVIIHNIERAMGLMKMKSGMGGKNIIWILLIVGVVLYLGYTALTGQPAL